MLTGYSLYDLERIEVKNAYLPDEWNNIHLMKLVGNCDDARMTVREMMQKVGTDALRNKVHENVWVNALLKDYKTTQVEGLYRNPNWIVTDTRFPNEFRAVRDRGGVLIRINRDNQERPETEHASEFALDNETGWDFVIQNDGSLIDLQFKVTEIWNKMKLTQNFLPLKSEIPV